jgi:hypothetical protein
LLGVFIDGKIDLRYPELRVCSLTAARYNVLIFPWVFSKSVSTGYSRVAGPLSVLDPQIRVNEGMLIAFWT